MNHEQTDEIIRILNWSTGYPGARHEKYTGEDRSFVPQSYPLYVGLFNNSADAITEPSEVAPVLYWGAATMEPYVFMAGGDYGERISECAEWGVTVTHELFTSKEEAFAASEIARLAIITEKESK